MDKFIPNTLIYDRFLLKEELSYDTNSGLRVWAVQDEQTDQAYIVYFHHDGRTEWFADNRQQSGKESEYGPNISRDPASVTEQKRFDVNNSGKPVIWRFVVILFLSALVAGYYYRDNILSIVKSFTGTRADNSARPDNQKDSRSISTLKTDSTAVVSENDTQHKTAWVDDFPETQQSIAEKKVSDVLQQFDVLPVEKHSAAFVDLRKALTALRQSGANGTLIGSVVTICLDKGDQSLLMHKQNGRQVFKQNAFEWYDAAFSLKPSPELLAKINKLKNVQGSKKRARVKKSSEKASPYFQRDPELNP